VREAESRTTSSRILGRSRMKEHEGEEDRAKESVGDDFAKDVSGEQAHTVLEISV